MIKHIIINVLFPKLKEDITNKSIGKIRSIVQKQKDFFALKKYEKNLDEVILQKYGTETFYDDLCKALLKNNNLHKLILRGKDRGLLDDKSDKEFVDDVLKHMVIPLYNRKNVVDALNYISDVIFCSFNELENADFIKLKNITKREEDISRQRIECVKKDTEKLLSNDKTILQELQTCKELILEPKDNKILSDSGNLKKSDVERIISGKYDLILSAKKQEDYFRVVADIKIDISTFNFNTFEEYVSYLRFSGKNAEFGVCYFALIDSQNIAVHKYEDTTYNGIKIRLPEIYVKEAPVTDNDITSMKVVITPQFDYESFQIENESGEIIIHNRQYKIEREIQGDNLYIHLLDKQTEHSCKVNLRICVKNTNPLITTTDLSIMQHDDTTAISNVEFFNIIRKTSIAKELVARRVSDGELLFVSQDVKCFQGDLLDNLDLKISFYSNLVRLERKLNVKFNVPNVIETDEVLNVEQILKVLEEGVTTLRTGQVTLNSNGIDFVDDNAIEKLTYAKEVMFLCHYQNITALDLELPISDYFRIVMFSNNLHFNDNGDIIMDCHDAYVYNEKLATLSENEIVDNLSHRILKISN